jgi:TolA-binding protein
LNQTEDALDFYEKAIAHSDNEFTTPRFLYKAGVAALELNQKSKALGYFERIKEDYPKSSEGVGIDALIGLAKN